MVRIAAAFDKGAHRAGALGLAQQHAVHAAPENLAELPGVVADMRGVDAVDRRLDDDRRGAVAGAGRPGRDEPGEIGGQPGHVEGAVLHPDIDVVGPGVRVFASLRLGQDMPGMGADIVDRLVLRQQLDRPVDACHGSLLSPYRRRRSTVRQVVVQAGMKQFAANRAGSCETSGRGRR